MYYKNKIFPFQYTHTTLLMYRVKDITYLLQIYSKFQHFVLCMLLWVAWNGWASHQNQALYAELSVQHCPCLLVPLVDPAGNNAQQFWWIQLTKGTLQSIYLNITNRVLLSPALHCLELILYSISISLHSSYNQLRSCFWIFIFICSFVFSCPSLTKALKLSCISIFWVSLPVSYNPSWNTKNICKFWQGIRIR